MATYEESLAGFEGKFTYVYTEDLRGNESFAPNGARYDQTFPRDESSRTPHATPATYDGADSAFAAWFEHAASAIPEGANTLFWRIMPHALLHNSRPFIFASLAFGMSDSAGQWFRQPNAPAA